MLLIGNFAPPYDDEGLHNLSLLKKLQEEGNECSVINISENPSKKKEFNDNKGLIDFLFKLIKLAWKSDVIHCFTRGYTRPGLIKIIASMVFGRIFRARPIITFHSELFSITAQMRSRLLGEPVLKLAFSLAYKVICSDKDTYETASAFKSRNNIELIPAFIFIPEYAKDNEPLSLKKLEDKKRVIFFSNVTYPSFVFEILNNMLSESLNANIGIVISMSEKLSAKLQHAIEETGKRLADNLVFIENDDIKTLSTAYARSDLTLRPLSSDGIMFFANFTLSVKKPLRSNNYTYFPQNLLLLKEGEVTDLCGHIISDVLMKDIETASQDSEENFYSKLKDIYSK